jgi:hypothetical protein
MKIKKNGKVITLTESDLNRIVKRVLNEQTDYSDTALRILLTVDSGDILWVSNTGLKDKYDTPLSKQEAQEVMKQMDEWGYLRSRELLNRGFELLSVLEDQPGFDPVKKLAELKSKYGNVPR